MLPFDYEVLFSLNETLIKDMQTSLWFFWIVV